MLTLSFEVGRWVRGHSRKRARDSASQQQATSSQKQNDELSDIVTRAEPL